MRLLLQQSKYAIIGIAALVRMQNQPRRGRNDIQRNVVKFNSLFHS